MKIIKATKSNIPDIIFLNSFVQKIHTINHPDVFKPPANGSDIERFFEQILEKENNYILIAYKGNKALGYIWAELQHKPENPFKYEQKRLYINHVSVHKESRGQGIGKALFDEIETIAKQNGITNFALDSWEFNEDTHKIFKKLGFSIYNINMWKK